MQLKINSLGNSAGVVLSKEILAKLNAKKGDILYVVETANGIELTPYDPELAKQMEVAMEVMEDNKDLLKQLADS